MGIPMSAMHSAWVKTRIVSNQLGYPGRFGGYENTGSFDDYGCQIEI